MLERLVRCAPAGSLAQHTAMVQLAEVLIPAAPWRAALWCRRVLAERELDRAYGVLGLALSMLGHHRSAARAYRHALALQPDSVCYAHNLGHLLDVGLGRPAEALRLLGAAHRAEPGEPEIAGSYALALARAGQRSQAERVLSAALGSRAEARALLVRWLG
jgi:Flp pilus assembly protein TadD